MVAVQMVTYDSAESSPMMNNMNNIPSLCQDMIGTYYGISPCGSLSLAHIRLVGSIFSTPALSLEKYLAMVHPFTRYRYLIKPVGCPT